jgi:hypothetical protein
MSHSIQEKSVTSVVSGNSTYERLETFVMHTVLTDPFYFHAFLGYLVLVVLSYAIMSYNSGKKALTAYKIGCSKQQNAPYSKNEAWLAAKNGIAIETWGNLCEAIFCPYTWVSQIMPYVVMYFNDKYDSVEGKEREEEEEE